jgi:hypothetical protein
MTAANDERDNIDHVANGPMGDGQIDPVAREDACPDCGERECDELVWLDDVHVECQICKFVYRPGRQLAGGFGPQHAWLRLLHAAQALIEARDNQMVTIAEWRALRQAIDKCRRYTKAGRPGGASDARDEATS